MRGHVLSVCHLWNIPIQINTHFNNIYSHRFVEINVGHIKFELINNNIYTFEAFILLYLGEQVYRNTQYKDKQLKYLNAFNVSVIIII